MNSLRDVFSHNLSLFRKNKGMSQASLAEAVDMQSQTINKYENGKSWPEPEIIEKIAKALGVEPHHLLVPIQKYEQSDKLLIAISSIKSIIENIEN